MRQRNWTFYKVVLYLGLIAAISLLGILCYVAFFRDRNHWKDLTVQLIMSGTLLQIIFYVLCIRLIHYYVPNRLQPGKPFSLCYTVLLVLNSCMAVGLLLVLAFGFSEAFLQRNSRPATEDYTALFVIGSYTFLTIYIAAASIVLQRYNRYQASTDEENWLNQLGNPSLNQ